MQAPFRALPQSRLTQVALLSLALIGAAQAQSLQEVYDMAKGYDATYQAARSQYSANLAKADQGKAGLLPGMSMSGSASRSAREVDPTPNPVATNYS